MINSTIAQQQLIKLPSDQNASGRTLGQEELALLAEAIHSGTLTSTKRYPIRGRIVNLGLQLAGKGGHLFVKRAKIPVEDLFRCKRGLSGKGLNWLPGFCCCVPPRFDIALLKYFKVVRFQAGAVSI